MSIVRVLNALSIVDMAASLCIAEVICLLLWANEFMRLAMIDGIACACLRQENAPQVLQESFVKTCEASAYRLVLALPSTASHMKGVQDNVCSQLILPRGDKGQTCSEFQHRESTADLAANDSMQSIIE